LARALASNLAPTYQEPMVAVGDIELWKRRWSILKERGSRVS